MRETAFYDPGIIRNPTVRTIAALGRAVRLQLPARPCTERVAPQQYGHFSKRCWRTLMKEAGLVQQVVINGEKRLQNLYTPYSLRHFYASMLIAERAVEVRSRP